MCVDNSNPLSYLLEVNYPLDLIQKQLDQTSISIDELANAVKQLLDKGLSIEDILNEYQDKYPDVISSVKFDGLEVDKRGVPLKTIRNFSLIFSHDSHYDSIRFNEMTNSAEITVTGKDGKQIIKQMDDTDDAVSEAYIQSEYGLYHPVMHEAAMKILLRDRSYNPLCDLVSSFKWDGENRIERFLTKYMKAKDSHYVQEVSRLIFAGGINRLFSPGCKFDDVPVLIGTKQGEGKSTIVEWLALNSSYTKVIDTLDGSQKAVEGLSGIWIGEVAELSAFRKSDIEALKSFITRTTDQYRKPYDRKVSVLPRRCIFIGTTNSRQFLSDRSGNRRFYPVEVFSNGYDLWKHEDEVREYISQCWAEALVRYKDGQMPPVANKELIEQYREAQDAAQIDDWRPGVIERYLDRLPDGHKVCIKELFKRALYPDGTQEPRRNDEVEIAQMMDQMPGWERMPKREQTIDYGRQRCWHRIESVHAESTITEVGKLQF